MVERYTYNVIIFIKHIIYVVVEHTTQIFS